MPKANICYTPSVCPDVMSVQLKYSVRKTPQGGGTVDIGDFVFRGNGAYDPDFASGGQQPMGFDQWSAFYRRYRVKAVKTNVLFINNAAVTAIGYISPLNTSAAITDKNIATENQYSKTVNLGQDAGNNQGNLTHYISTAKMRGGPADIVSYEQDLSALNSTVPNQEFYIHVGAYGVGSSNVNFEVDCEVTLTYYIEFYDRESLVRS